MIFGFVVRKLDKRRLWDALREYPEYTPPFRGESIKRRHAEQNFQFFMDQRATRLDYLRRFLSSFRVDLALEQESLPPIDRWLLRYGGYLLPERGVAITAFEEFEPRFINEFAGLNIVNDISIFAGEYVVKYNPTTKWGLFTGDGMRRSREFLGYYQPCIYGVHPHQPGYRAEYPLNIRDEIFQCCTSSEQRLSGRCLPSNRDEEFFRQWGDDNEFVRRLKYWARESADPPTPFSPTCFTLIPTASPSDSRGFPWRGFSDSFGAKEIRAMPAVDWHFNVRVWDSAANSGISFETLAD